MDDIDQSSGSQLLCIGVHFSNMLSIFCRNGGLAAAQCSGPSPGGSPGMLFDHPRLCYSVFFCRRARAASLPSSPVRCSPIGLRSAAASGRPLDVKNPPNGGFDHVPVLLSARFEFWKIGCSARRCKCGKSIEVGEAIRIFFLEVFHSVLGKPDSAEPTAKLC